jgi:hypothetical protein
VWRARRATIGEATERWSIVGAAGRPLSFADTVRGWHVDVSFRTSWCGWLRDLDLDAYAWECPPVTDATSSRPFECVFISSPALARMPPEPEAFAEHFRGPAGVVTFTNLGGDAILVAPRPLGSDSDFTHLARFVETATAEQADSLWQAVGEAMAKRIGSMPVWLSTAGLGVGWLHVRLDDRPKYYRHEAYRQA